MSESDDFFTEAVYQEEENDIELLKSILEQWDSDSGRPLANFFYNNTQTLVLCYSQPLPKSTNKIKTKQAH